MSRRYRLLHLSRWTLWEWWVVATVVSEVVGLSIVAVVGATIGQLDSASTHGMLLLIGSLEGCILGFAQWLVLRRYIRHAGWWIFATAVGAVFAWIIGLTVSVLMAFVYASSSDRIQTTAFIKGVIVLGAGVGAVMGFSQWLVLKAHIRNAVWWIFANAIAWSLGLLVAFIGAGLLSSAGFGLETALKVAATGVTMGAVVGGITGIALVWLFRPRHHSHH